MTKTDSQSKKERYEKLESKPTWRAIKLILITVIVIISLFATVGLWSEVSDCYTSSEAHDTWTPSDARNFYRGAQPRGCDVQAATQTGGVVTVLVPIAGWLIYKLCRYTAAYVAYGSEKRTRV